MKKSDLDRSISVMTGIPLNEVQVVTDCFTHRLVEELIEHREIRLPMLGLLRVHGTRNRVGIRLTKDVRRKLKEKAMEKYGVDESAQVPDSLEKVAKEKNKCPECGANLEQHGKVVKCPNCGTEPFEK